MCTILFCGWHSYFCEHIIGWVIRWLPSIHQEYKVMSKASLCVCVSCECVKLWYTNSKSCRICCYIWRGFLEQRIWVLKASRAYVHRRDLVLSKRDSPQEVFYIKAFTQGLGSSFSLYSCSPPPPLRRVGWSPRQARRLTAPSIRYRAMSRALRRQCVRHTGIVVSLPTYRTCPLSVI